MSDEDPQAEIVLELAEEFLGRYRKGERPPLREYLDRHPELAAEIREVFPAMAMLENIAVVDESLEDTGQGPGAGGQKSPALEQLGDYRIIREIGHGGMGVVYEAEQISLGRYVALKVLPHKALANEKTKKRFEREAKAAAKLHHTNIVPVFGVGEHEGLPYYAMQFIQGLGLDLVLEELKRLKDRGGNMGQVASLVISGAQVSGAVHRGVSAADMARSLVVGEFQPASSPKGEEASAGLPERAHGNVSVPKGSVSASSSSLAISSGSIILPGQGGGQGGTEHTHQGKRRTYWHSVAQTGVQVADALEYAHKQGIIHRDIKPSNLLLDTSGTVWVTDFGLAKADDHQDITHAGDVLGTLRYMPPEAFEGKADGRGDVYSLGLTLYELLAFRPAFEDKDRNRLVKKVTTEEPARLDRLNREVPRDLVTIVHKAIARDPAHRYQTPAEMAEDLKRFVEDRPVRARRISETERLWRWCRRNPLPASLVAGIVLMFLTGFAGVFWQWREAETAREHEKNERSRAEKLRQGAETARDEADQASAASEKSRQVAETLRQGAEKARAAEEKSRLAAEAETYRAVLSEARALRAGHQSGWREKALSDLARLAVMPTPRRDLTELRTEAAAVLATPDIRHVETIDVPSNDLGSFTFSPDGRTLLMAGIQNGLEFWDVKGRSRFSLAKGLTVSKAGFDNAVYFPDGQSLAVGTRDQGVVFTDPHGVRTTRAPITQGKSQPTKLAIDANGQRIAVAWTDGAGITIHELANGALLEKFKDSAAPFALRPDGRWLARAEGADIVLLPIASKEPRIVLGRRGGAMAMAFSPDGTMLAAAFRDHATVIWDVAKREQIGILRHRERAIEVAFSPDGDWIASAGMDYTVRIWETRTGQHVASLPSFAPVRRLRWCPTGDYLATSTQHSTRDVYLYKITGRRHVQQWLTGHTFELRRVAAHPRLDRLATSGYTELMSWDLSGPRPARVAFEPNPGAVTALAYSHDGALLATASWLGATRVVLVREASTGKVRSRIAMPHDIWALAFDPTGERIVCGDAAGNVVVWDFVTASSIHKFKTGAYIRSIVFLEHPRCVVTHGKDEVFLFNLEPGKAPQNVKFEGEAIRSLAADRTGSRLVVGFQSGALASLSLPDLARGPRLENAHKKSVDCLALSPDGRLLATGADHRVVLLDARSLEPLLEFPVWAGELRDLTFDSKGHRLAIVGTDSDVDLWDLGALHDGLKDVGLAWDRPEHAEAPAPVLAPKGEHLRPAIPVIHPMPPRTPSP